MNCDYCEKPGVAREMCQMHYKRWQMGQDMDAAPKDRPWGADEVDLLRRHYAQSSPGLRAFGEKTGRHPANVARKARLLGIEVGKKWRRGDQLKIDFALPIGSPESKRRIGERTRAMISRNGHPRGMLGKKHSAETLQRLSEASLAKWRDPKSKLNGPINRKRLSDLMLVKLASGKMNSGYGRAKRGVRADVGAMHFRSSWEANYARYLNWLIKRGEVRAWEFETKKFVFEEIQFGVRSYLPDFKVIYPDGHHEWHEVKGWMDAKSKTKLKRMAKYFPDEKLKVIGSGFFKSMKISGVAGMIAGWE